MTLEQRLITTIENGSLQECALENYLLIQAEQLSGLEASIYTLWDQLLDRMLMLGTEDFPKMKLTSDDCLYLAHRALEIGKELEIEKRIN